MLYNAKNGALKMGETTMDYIRFGTGSRTLVILPGLGDALQTVKGTALPMAWMYRIFAKDFTVYAFSRKNALPERYSTRDMARDMAQAMDDLGIAQADRIQRREHRQQGCSRFLLKGESNIQNRLQRDHGNPIQGGHS